MKQYFLRQIKSEIWANKMIADAIEKAHEPAERTLVLFSHILSAYSMWLSRINGTAITCTLFQDRTLAECKILMNEVFEGYTNHITNADENELNRIVHFTFPLDGSKRKMAVADALTHVVTHSFYHRGQIVTSLKGKIEPLPLTTYIAFASEMDS